LPTRGKLGTLHDLAMRRLDDKLLQRGFAFPHRQGPKLSLEDTCQQRVAEQTRCPSQLALDAPRVERESAQVAKALQRECRQQDQYSRSGSGWRKVTQGFAGTVPPRLTWPLLAQHGEGAEEPAHVLKT
jgi:hypothetical protein